SLDDVVLLLVLGEVELAPEEVVGQLERIALVGSLHTERRAGWLTQVVDHLGGAVGHPRTEPPRRGRVDLVPWAGADRDELGCCHGGDGRAAAAAGPTSGWPFVGAPAGHRRRGRSSRVLLTSARTYARPPWAVLLAGDDATRRHFARPGDRRRGCVAVPRGRARAGARRAAARALAGPLRGRRDRRRGVAGRARPGSRSRVGCSCGRPLA